MENEVEQILEKEIGMEKLKEKLPPHQIQNLKNALQQNCDLKNELIANEKRIVETAKAIIGKITLDEHGKPTIS